MLSLGDSSFLTKSWRQLLSRFGIYVKTYVNTVILASCEHSMQVTVICPHLSLHRHGLSMDWVGVTRLGPPLVWGVAYSMVEI